MTQRTINPRDLSRSQQSRLQGRGSDSERWVENPPIGDLAEELVAEEYGLSTGSGSQGRYWDAVAPDKDRTEVKSTQTRVGAGQNASETEQGRFRLFRGQIEELVEYDERHDRDAFVAFVMFHEPDGVIYLTRLTPAEVLEIIEDEYGGWDESGHEEMGEQQKLPWDAVIDA